MWTSKRADELTLYFSRFDVAIVVAISGRIVELILASDRDAEDAECESAVPFCFTILLSRLQLWIANVLQKQVYTLNGRKVERARECKKAYKIPEANTRATPTFFLRSIFISHTKGNRMMIKAEPVMMLQKP